MPLDSNGLIVRLDDGDNWQRITKDEAKRLAMDLLRELGVWKPNEPPSLQNPAEL